MLVILVGGTLDVAKKSREYFKDNGYVVIQKYNYLPETSLKEHVDTFENLPKEEVDKCDFKYSIHGGITGFYKRQFIDAARGRCNALMTASPDNLDFVKEIKDAYGDYVRLVYLYIDKTSLEVMTRRQIKKEEEIIERLRKGGELRELYNREKALYDRVVIYEENGQLGMKALFDQYDLIMNEAKELQDKLNKRYEVDLPYKGPLDYIFVSYSHKDESLVMPILSALQKEGYRIWYDKGINVGSNWLVMIGERIQGCTNFMLFSSENSSQSKRVYEEINGAMMKEELKPIVVRLDNAKFPFGYEMYLNTYQNVHVASDDALACLMEGLSPLTKN